MGAGFIVGSIKSCTGVFRLISPGSGGVFGFGGSGVLCLGGVGVAKSLIGPGKIRFPDT